MASFSSHREESPAAFPDRQSALPAAVFHPTPVHPRAQAGPEVRIYDANTGKLIRKGTAGPGPPGSLPVHVEHSSFRYICRPSRDSLSGSDLSQLSQLLNEVLVECACEVRGWFCPELEVGYQAEGSDSQPLETPHPRTPAPFCMFFFRLWSQNWSRQIRGLPCEKPCTCACKCPRSHAGSVPSCTGCFICRPDKCGTAGPSPPSRAQAWEGLDLTPSCLALPGPSLLRDGQELCGRKDELGACAQNQLCSSSRHSLPGRPLLLPRSDRTKAGVRMAVCK